MTVYSRLAIAAALLALSACRAPYAEFYHPSLLPPGMVAAANGEPRLAPSSGDPKRDVLSMYEDGYGLVGYSSFVGRAQGPAGAIAQAKKVGAEIVILSAKYRNTETGTIPLTTPTATTAYSSGTVNIMGPGGGGFGNYSGTTTVYGIETTLIPYSVDKYDQGALYFAPLQRKGLGIYFDKLTDDQRRALGSNQGMLVAALRKGSPAFVADILPGDIVLSIDGTPVYDVASLRGAVDAAEGRTVDVAVFRGGASITKTVPITW